MYSYLCVWCVHVYLCVRACVHSCMCVNACVVCVCVHACYEHWCVAYVFPNSSYINCHIPMVPSVVCSIQCKYTHM